MAIKLTLAQAQLLRKIKRLGLIYPRAMSGHERQSVGGLIREGLVESTEDPVRYKITPKGQSW